MILVIGKSNFKKIESNYLKSQAPPICVQDVPVLQMRASPRHRAWFLSREFVLGSCVLPAGWSYSGEREWSNPVVFHSHVDVVHDSAVWTRKLRRPWKTRNSDRRGALLSYRVRQQRAAQTVSANNSLLFPPWDKKRAPLTSDSEPTW